MLHSDLLGDGVFTMCPSVRTPCSKGSIAQGAKAARELRASCVVTVRRPPPPGARRQAGGLRKAGPLGLNSGGGSERSSGA
eukprot:2587243-Pyramimonas_sp.AAC.1